ncbi:hypothetical protein [Intestinibacillus sp. Marseille-P6563]|uniref:hypothetical protein n=1 Tax=Intestinibacillus sp. Marseille-P6563 TaxID=2364792 RepID=UPI0013DED5D8|nr:hypothetical protein [Intestinibacillus sp. Marseille-P6563]
MRKFTQAEFDLFHIDSNGYKICPTGDYSQIKSFHNRCKFEEYSYFGDYSCFGNECVFGRKCSFGAFSLFGKRCTFDDMCIFQIGCEFLDSCSFGIRCIFALCCKFEDKCNFGAISSFGKQCKFGEKCRCEFGEFRYMVSFCGIFEELNSTDVFLLANDSICVRQGLFGGTLKEFVTYCKTRYSSENHGKTYIDLISAIKSQFEIMRGRSLT